MSQIVPADQGTNGGPTLEQQRTVATATVLANAGEVAVGIVSQIAGNDISTAINGNKATNEVIQGLLYQRISKRVLEASKGS